MAARLDRRARRAAHHERIAFLRPDDLVPGTSHTVQDARSGHFTGSEIPVDLRRQWIQGTGPGAKPGAAIPQSIRNVAHALLSGADGWMFDGEDALGQLSTMSLDNQRNLKLAIAGDPVFLHTAEAVAGEMNAWGEQFFGHPIVASWRDQLRFTTKIFRPRGLHLDDRQIRHGDGAGFSASIADVVLYVVNNARALAASGASIVLYLPKIQTAEEAAVWSALLDQLEAQQGLTPGTIRTYVLVEQIEACFQLMEIRAALGAFRGLQHRAVGLHQQRRRCDDLGSGLHQPEHRRRDDDLRVHACV
jgi:malate synthase